MIFRDQYLGSLVKLAFFALCAFAYGHMAVKELRKLDF